MVPWIISAKHIKDFTVWLSFNDGAEGEVDLSSELEGEIFEPLKDVLSRQYDNVLYYQV